MSANLLRVSRRLRWVAVTIPATPPPTTTIRCISLALLRRCTCPLQELQGGRCGVWIETLKVSIGRERAHRQDITVWRRDHADDALRSGPKHAGAFGEMVLAQGLGDEDCQASRNEKGDRRPGASAGRDHAPHVG